MAVSQRIEYIITDDHDDGEVAIASRGQDDDGNDIVTLSQPGNDITLTVKMAAELAGVLAKISRD